MNVMVIEDSSDMRYLLSELLPHHAPEIAEVRAAAHEAEALEVIDEFRPDVVILDSCTSGPPPRHTADLLRSINPQVVLVSFSGLTDPAADWADVVVGKSGQGITRLAWILSSLAADMSRA